MKLELNRNVLKLIMTVIASMIAEITNLLVPVVEKMGIKPGVVVRVGRRLALVTNSVTSCVTGKDGVPVDVFVGVAFITGGVVNPKGTSVRLSKITEVLKASEAKKVLKEAEEKAKAKAEKPKRAPKPPKTDKTAKPAAVRKPRKPRNASQEQAAE